MMLTIILTISFISKCEEINYTKYGVNEMGKIMVVMYHNFTLGEPTDSYSRELKKFRNDLEYFYKNNYYPISIQDFINGKIDIPLGKTPILLTFDDGHKSQASFSMVNGNLELNKNTMLYEYIEFTKENKDFPLKGIIYINKNPFFGDGTIKERIRKVLDLGFDIGNHTYSHINLKKASKEEIEKEMGLIVMLLNDIKEGYKVNSLARPYGIGSNLHRESVVEGEYKGIKYHNEAIFLVGSNPSESVYSKKFNLEMVPRIRAGKGKENLDIDYWIKYFENNPKERYVSDGNPNTVVIPKGKENSIDENKVFGKEIIIY